MKIIITTLLILIVAVLQAQDVKYKLKGSNTFLTKEQVDSISAKYGNNIKFSFHKNNNEMLAILDIGETTKKDEGTNTAGNGKLNYGQVKYKDINNKNISKDEFLEKYKSGKYARHYEMEENEGKYDITWSLKKDNLEKINENKYINLKGAKLPDFYLKDLDNNLITTTSLKGKLTVLNIWFIGCKPCEKEIPDLNKVVETFKSNNDVVFIAPAWNNNKEQLINFLKRKPFNYDVLVDADSLIKDLNIGIYPTHLIIDKEGYIKEVILGAKDNIKLLLTDAINKNLK